MSKHSVKTKSRKTALLPPAGRLLGYARVSTTEQILDLQMDALQAAGCERIYTDTKSGARAERKGLSDCLEALRPGDTLVVWKLDRLGRSLQHLIETVNDLRERGIGFSSLIENINTTTPSGKFLFHVFGALAEFEREIIRERINAGLEAARRRGRVGGRPRKMNASTIETARVMLDGGLSLGNVARTLIVSRSTLYRHLGKE